MGKILKSWSGMRKYLEKEMLAESLKGRIRYNCTRYVGMDMDHIFEVYVDNKLVKQFSLETVNSYFLRMGISSDKDNNIKNTIGIRGYWSDFWSTMSKYPMCDRDEYTDDEFCDALAIYRNSKILDSIESDNPIVRMFAILDRRIGKRSLKEIKNKIGEQPEWLRFFYLLRIEAERVD